MERFKFEHIITVRKCTAFFGLFSLASLTVSFYWALEQPSRLQLLEYYLLQRQEEYETAQVVVSNVLDIIYRPWGDDPDCRDYTIGFIRNGTRPTMALISYPGSGNTWIRGIIERLSGYFTGSVYADKSLYRKGFYGEVMSTDCGCTIAQKTHDFEKKDFDKPFVNQSAILIIRNPYSALVSYRNFVTTGFNHTASTSLSQFAGPEWRKFVRKEIVRWKNTTLQWIPKIRNGGILLYEELLQDKPKQFRLLMRYLDLEVDERRLDCVIKHDFQTFKRNSTHSTKSAKKRDPFDSILRGVINKEIKNTQKILTDYGYELKLLK